MDYLAKEDVPLYIPIIFEIYLSGMNKVLCNCS